MPQFQSALYVAGIEEALKSRSFGLQLANDFDDAVVNQLQTIDEGIGWLQPDRAAVDKATFCAIAVDDAVTGNSGSTIDAEDPH